MSRILIIEDQSDIRRLIRWSLEFEEHEIHEASNGPQGLRVAKSVLPDLVLLDVMMPGGLDGYEVCAQIKADPALAHAPVVMLSARAQARDREAGQRVGADAYLVKPFSPLELVDTIGRLLRGAAGPQGGSD
jgi:CheY-like chemotaxis protein